MFETRIKPLSELPPLSGLEREEHGLPRNWTFSKDHRDLEPGQWAVAHVHEDLSEDLYPLPMWVSVLVDHNRNWEREDIQRQLQALMGL